MNDRLTREEVLHVAHLARIGISEEEISNYQLSLKQMIDEIDKIRSIEDIDGEMMISPSMEEVSLTKKEVNVANNGLLKNVPSKKGNFVEVPVVINE